MTRGYRYQATGPLGCFQGTGPCIQWCAASSARGFGPWCAPWVDPLGLSENRVYPQWNSHLIGIMISKTIGFRGTLFSDKPTGPPFWIFPKSMERIETLTCSCRLDAGHYPLDTGSRATLQLGKCPMNNQRVNHQKLYTYNSGEWMQVVYKTGPNRFFQTGPGSPHINIYIYILLFISAYIPVASLASAWSRSISRYITEAQSSNGESCFCGTLALGHRRTAILRNTASRMHWQIFRNSPR